MAKEMGEFEKRPKVQEAMPSPFRRRRPIGWMVATLFFAVVAVAAISFIIIDKVSDRADNCVKASEETVKKQKNLTPEEEITALFDDIQPVFEEYISDKSLIKRENDNMVVISIKEGLMSYSEKGKTIMIPDVHRKNIEAVKEIDKNQEAFDADVTDVLKKHGFEIDEDTNIEGFYYTYSYKNENGVVCQFVNGENRNTISVDCAHESWIPADQKELITGLYDAFVESECSNGVECDEGILLYAKTSDIKNSSVKGYQRIEAEFGLQHARFYRKANEKWNYIKQDDMMVRCKYYNDDAKKAWAGEYCYTDDDKEKKLGE